MTEIWKDVPFTGYDVVYSGSNLGNVMNKRTGKLLKPKINKYGYLEFCLCVDNKRKYVTGHKITALLFVDNPDPIKNTQVNHKDENKLNNCYTNLEWCDALYNVTYGTGIERKNKHKKSVVQYTTEGEFVNEFPSISEASKQTGIKQGHICSCCQHKPEHITAGGYKWEYKKRPLIKETALVIC